MGPHWTCGFWETTCVKHHTLQSYGCNGTVVLVSRRGAPARLSFELLLVFFQTENILQTFFFWETNTLQYQIPEETDKLCYVNKV